MDTRRLQRTGGSTITVSLPKPWVDARGLKAGDNIALIQLEDGSLLLDPAPGPAPDLSIDVTPPRDLDDDHLLRQLIGLYIKGYRRITILAPGQSPLEPGVRHLVQRFTEMTIGPEILEEEDRRILIRDLLNPAEIPTLTAIRRMHLLARTMHQEAITCFLDGDAERTRELERRDGDIDRLLWLVERQFNSLLRDPALQRKLGSSQSTVLVYLLVARYLERIGDHSLNIASNPIPRSARAKIRTIATGIEAAEGRILAILDQAMEGLYRGDLEQANSAILGISAESAEQDRILAAIAGCDGETAQSLGRVATSVQRTGAYTRDIAECCFNLYSDQAVAKG